MFSDWGGKREGSGRKPKHGVKKTRLNIGLNPELVEWLEEVTDNKSEYIEAALELAKVQNLVVIRVETAGKELLFWSFDNNKEEYIDNIPDHQTKELEEKQADWIFYISGNEFEFRGTLNEVKATAIAQALEANVRVVEIVRN